MKSSFWKKSVALLSLAGVTLSFTAAYDMAVKDKERSFVYRTIAQMSEDNESASEMTVTNEESDLISSEDLDSNLDELSPLDRAKEKIVKLQADHEVFAQDFSLFYAEILNEEFANKAKEELYLTEAKSDLDIFTQRANQLNKRSIEISEELSKINSEENLDNEGLLEALNEVSLLNDRQEAISANMARISEKIDEVDAKEEVIVVAEEEKKEEKKEESEEELEEIVVNVEKKEIKEEVEVDESQKRITNLEKQICEQKSILEELKSSFDSSLSEIKKAIAELSSDEKEEDKDKKEDKKEDKKDKTDNIKNIAQFQSPFNYFSYLQHLRDQNNAAHGVTRDYNAEYMNSFYMMQMMQMMNRGGAVNQTNYYGDVFYAPMVPQLHNGFNNRTPSAYGPGMVFDFSNPTDLPRIPVSPRTYGANGSFAI